MAAARPDHFASTGEVVKVSAECPNCHQRPAIVFPAVRGAANPKDAKLVCLECCPKAPADD